MNQLLHSTGSKVLKDQACIKAPSSKQDSDSHILNIHARGKKYGCSYQKMLEWALKLAKAGGICYQALALLSKVLFSKIWNPSLSIFMAILLGSKYRDATCFCLLCSSIYYYHTYENNHLFILFHWLPGTIWKLIRLQLWIALSIYEGAVI